MKDIYQEIDFWEEFQVAKNNNPPKSNGADVELTDKKNSISHW